MSSDGAWNDNIDGVTANIHRAQELSEGFCYPEAPRWHGGHLWFSDQHDHTVWRLDSTGERAWSQRFDDVPSGLGWIPNGSVHGEDLLVVAMDGRKVLKVEPDGRVSTFADLAAHHRGPSNDMVVAGPDLAFVGNIGFDFYAGESLTDTVLLRLRANGDVEVAAEAMVCPNGLAISPDRDRLYVAESLAGRITTFSIGVDGALSDRRVLIELPDQRPDGICIDADGAVWAALARTDEAVRVDASGRVTDIARSSGNSVYACALGGADRRTLYLCTSASDEPADALRLRSGKIESCIVDVAGAGWP